MAVIVNPSESIDSALKRLLRESLREGILQTARERMYHVSETKLDREKRRAWRKTKRKRRQHNRRLRQKSG
jgi:ribosomal protein S21